MVGFNHGVFDCEKANWMFTGNPLHESGQNGCVVYWTAVLWIAQWYIFVGSTMVETFHRTGNTSFDTEAVNRFNNRSAISDLPKRIRTGGHWLSQAGKRV